MENRHTGDNNALAKEFSYYAEVHIWTEILNEFVSLDLEERHIQAMSEWATALEGVGIGLLVKGEAYKFLSTVLGMTAEEAGKTLQTGIRNFNARRTAETFARIYKRFNEEGIEAHRVPPKLLFPILEGLSFEEDEYLKEKWTNLLASSIADGEVHPSYTLILSQLSSLDAKVLDAIDRVEKASSRFNVDTESILRELSTALDIDEIYNKIVQRIRLTAEEIDKQKVSTDLIGASIDSLKRLFLIEAPQQRHLGLSAPSPGIGGIVNVTDDNSYVGISNLGKRFLEAVNSSKIAS